MSGCVVLHIERGFSMWERGKYGHTAPGTLYRTQDEGILVIMP
jgi:hypothetical protein